MAILAGKQGMIDMAGLRMLPVAGVAWGDRHPAPERLQEAQPEELGVAIVTRIQYVPLSSSPLTRFMLLHLPKLKSDPNQSIQGMHIGA